MSEAAEALALVNEYLVAEMEVSNPCTQAEWTSLRDKRRNVAGKLAKSNYPVAQAIAATMLTHRGFKVSLANGFGSLISKLSEEAAEVCR